MNRLFSKGDRKTHSFTVTKEDLAAFHGKVVHQVCSTFALAREIEWSSRLFVLEMKELDEEGIGTMLAIYHQSPAMVGQTMNFTATVVSILNNELICDIIAEVDGRIVASGRTGQKVFKKEKIELLFKAVK
jgi:predicted thioesterase